MGPCDSFLFPQMKNIFKSKWFQDTEMINAMQQLLEIPKTVREVLE